MNAPVKWLGWQENILGRPSLELWNLTASVGRFTQGSTVSRTTLENELGLTVPPAPVRDPYAPRTYAAA